MFDVEVNYDIAEEFKKVLELLKSIKKKRVLICGNPKAVDNFKNIIDQGKELFSEYDFNYHSSEKLGDDETQVYLIPYEERTKPLFVYIADNEEKEEEK